MSLYVIICHYMSLYVIICHYMSLYVIICHINVIFMSYYMSLYVILYVTVHGWPCHVGDQTDIALDSAQFLQHTANA